jgi:hypothetical protein
MAVREQLETTVRSYSVPNFTSTISSANYHAQFLKGDTRRGLRTDDLRISRLATG